MINVKWGKITRVDPTSIIAVTTKNMRLPTKVKTTSIVDERWHAKGSGTPTQVSLLFRTTL